MLLSKNIKLDWKSASVKSRTELFLFIKLLPLSLPNLKCLLDHKDVKYFVSFKNVTL